LNPKTQQVIQSIERLRL